MSCSDIFLGLIAILFPPIAVWIKSGLCSADSLLNILLCMLGYLPGLLHAWYIIAKYPEHDYDRVDDTERQERVTYYYISNADGQGRRQGQPAGRAYGTQGGARGPIVPGNKPQSQRQSGTVRLNNGAPSTAGPAGSSAGASPEHLGAPPSYSEVVRGDNKIQSED